MCLIMKLKTLIIFVFITFVTVSAHAKLHRSSDIRDLWFVSHLEIMLDTATIQSLGLEHSLETKEELNFGSWCMNLGRLEQKLIEGAEYKNAESPIQKDFELRGFRITGEHRKIYREFCENHLGRVPNYIDLASDLKSLKIELINFLEEIKTARCLR